MSERFGFACFLPEPHLTSPASAISAAAAALPDRIGSPIEAMVLDVQSNRTEKRQWPTGETLLHRHPGPTELLFVYYASLRSNSGRICIGFRRTMVAATITVSLEDMAIADQDAEIAGACRRLRSFGLASAADCVVAAGGEIAFDENAETSEQALATLLVPLSLAQWIACDGAMLPRGYLGFEVACRVGSTCVLRRR
jgi:hypothetical protein